MPRIADVVRPFRSAQPRPDVPTRQCEARPRCPGARDPRRVARAADIRTAPCPERGRPEMELPRRADHRQQPDGRPPRLGPGVQGCLPAVPRDARRGPTLAERVRLPGPVGRGQRRAGPGVHEQAGHRGLRDRRVRLALQTARPDLCRPPDGAERPARDVDGLERPGRAPPPARPPRGGSLPAHDDRGSGRACHRQRRDARRAAGHARRRRQLLHVQQREQRPDLGLPQGMPSPRLALQGPRHDAVVRALRDRHLADGDERGLRRPRGSGPHDPPAARRSAGRGPAGMDDDAVDADLERGRGGRTGAALRQGPPGRCDPLAREGHSQAGLDRNVRGPRGAAWLGAGRLALRRPVRRPARGPEGLRDRRLTDRGGCAVRAPRRRLGRGRRGGGDRHRPRRPGLRRGGLRPRQGARPADDRPARRERHRRRWVRIADRARRPRRDRSDRRAPEARGPLLPPRALPASLSALLAMPDPARLPARRRVVHQHGSGLRQAPRGADARGGRCEPPLPDHGGRRPDPVDPVVRLRPGARLAPEHARLDDQQEALLGPGAADLRLHRVRHLRRDRLQRRHLRRHHRRRRLRLGQPDQDQFRHPDAQRRQHVQRRHHDQQRHSAHQQ